MTCSPIFYKRKDMNGTDRKIQAEYERKQAARRALRKKKQKRAVIFKIMCVVFCFVILGITAREVMRLWKGREAKPVARQGIVLKKTVQTPPEIDEQLLTVNEFSRPGIPLEEVKGIVIHYTANPGTTAQQNRDYFEGLRLSRETSASSHFVIGIDGELIQCIPCNEIAYASNERNADTIAVECCIPDDTGKFANATYGELLHLVAWLMGRYGLEIDDVIRHYDVTGKACPKYYVEYASEWDALKADICDYIDKYGTLEE